MRTYLKNRTEILQYQETSVINDYNIEDDIGIDVSCNLGSIDIHKATKVEDFGELVDTAMHLLTSVSTMTSIDNVPSVAKGNDLMHSVGLGVMNLNGHLVTQGLLYGEQDSIDFIDYFMEAMNYYSIKSSMEIAKKRGETFYGFEGSTYSTGKYFDQYVNKNDSAEFLNPVAVQALGNVPIITSTMWKELKEQVAKHGLFHSYRIAIAPTGSISYIRNSTASIAPITEKVEIRDYGTSRTIYPMPFLTNENQHLYKEAYDINQFKMVDLYAAAQKHVDQGISMTVYITDQWDTEKLTKLYAYAHHKGIKTVYYIRQRLTNMGKLVEKTIAECEACAI